MSLRPTITTGLPSGTKEAGRRVDFKPSNFDLAIVTKGYRAWWSRCGICPCRNNDQTDQAAVNCTLCSGTGWFFYLPEIGLDAYEEDQHGNAITINDAGDAVMIDALMTSQTLDPQIYEKFGEWLFGTAKVTVQPENKLAYRDRLVLADSTMMWGQLIEANGASVIPVTNGLSKHGLRYPAVSVNMLRTVATIFREGTHYTVDPAGTITWLVTPPAEETLLSINYLIHPVFRIMDHVYAYRDTPVAAKTKALSRAAQHQPLPLHAIAKLDYLEGGQA